MYLYNDKNIWKNITKLIGLVIFFHSFFHRSAMFLSIYPLSKMTDSQSYTSLMNCYSSIFGIFTFICIPLLGPILLEYKISGSKGRLPTAKGNVWDDGFINVCL
jgi:hypothetical protein